MASYQASGRSLTHPLRPWSQQIAGQFMSNNPGWRYLLGGTAAVAVFQLITAPFLPESPKCVVVG